MTFDEAWLQQHNAKMAKLRGEPVQPPPTLIEFSLPFLLRLPNRTNGFHWSAGHAYRKSLLGPVAQALEPWQGHQPMERARVTVVRFSTKPVDRDNLYASIKPLVDLLLVRSKAHPSSFGICRDDDPEHMQQFAVSHIVRYRTDQRTEVGIEKL